MRVLPVWLDKALGAIDPYPLSPRFLSFGGDHVNASVQQRPITPLFVAITAVFIASLISANIIAVKLVVIAGQVLPAAIVIFPVSYIVGDVLTEVYGYRRARAVIWLGFVSNLLVVAAIWIGGQLPPAGFWQENQQA